MLRVKFFKDNFKSRMAKPKDGEHKVYGFRWRDFRYKKYYTPIGKKLYFIEDGYKETIVEVHYLFSTPFLSLRIDIKPNTIK